MPSHVVKMPDLGEGITEVEVVAWHVQAGDTVSEDQVLADVMTDKATVEIPSPVAGTVSRLGGAVGEVLAVGAALIEITLDGDAAPAQSPAAAVVPAAGAAKAQTSAPAGAAARPPATSRPDTKSETRSDTKSEAGTSPTANRAAPAPPLDGHSAATAAQPGGNIARADNPIASPALRRRAWELGIDLHSVTPSGAGGRILQADLEQHVALHGSGAPQSAREAPTRAARPGVDEDTQVRVIGLRRRIAQKMLESKRRIPHFTYVEECDLTELEALRAQLNTRFGAARARLTVLPFLVRAIVLALRDFPQINARFDDEQGIVTQHGAVHMGIATQTDAGLMVPVLRHAQDGDLWANALEITRLAEMTRAGKATRDELSGSTITLTSLGALGGIVSTPIINMPEVAIVGVNRIIEKPVVLGGAFVARKMMNLSSSFDHRVVDGQDAAKFIQAVRGFLEVPGTLFVE